MHTTALALETLELLWANYLALCERVDLNSMPPDALDIHVKNNSPERPFRIAAWLAHQAFFISAWSLWEYHSRNLCHGLPTKVRREENESTVNWVARSLVANQMKFSDHAWFASANSIRNLIAHSGANVHNPGGKKLLERLQSAFPGICTWPDGYLALEHSHTAELTTKIDEFIRESMQHNDGTEHQYLP